MPRQPENVQDLRDQINTPATQKDCKGVACIKKQGILFAVLSALLLSTLIAGFKYHSNKMAMFEGDSTKKIEMLTAKVKAEKNKHQKAVDIITQKERRIRNISSIHSTDLVGVVRAQYAQERMWQHIGCGDIDDYIKSTCGHKRGIKKMLSTRAHSRCGIAYYIFVCVNR